MAIERIDARFDLLAIDRINEGHVEQKVIAEVSLTLKQLQEMLIKYAGHPAIKMLVEAAMTRRLSELTKN